jgi:hypothetical protein
MMFVLVALLAAASVRAQDGWLTRVGQWPVERIDSVSKNAGFGNQRQPINKFLLHTMEGTG